MTEGQGFRAAAVPLAGFAAVMALLVAPASAAAMAGPASGLSPRLAELAKPSVRSAPDAVQAKKLGLAPRGPGSLLRRGNRVLVYVRFDHGAATGVDALRVVGAEVVNTSPRYQTVTVAAKPAELRSLGRVPNVAGVTEALTPVTAATCPSGEIVSKGDEQLKAKQARSNFLVNGSGVTVGILSDSFDQAIEAADDSGPVETHALEDEESGDLPGPESPCENKSKVEVLEEDEPDPEDEEPPADEGRAMAQIVHDLAPGASVDFASAFNGEPKFAENIGKLATEGAKVIADDVFYLEEPYFQDGPVAVAVNKAVEGGATYLSAAGNDNLVDEGHDIGSWETPEYRDAGSCPPEVQAVPEANGAHCLDFNPGTQVDRTLGIKVEPGATLIADVQWDEPWFGVTTDLDAFLLNSNGNLIAADGLPNIVFGQPVEIVEWTNESSSRRTVQLVLNRFAGGDPRVKVGLLENGFGVVATEYPRSSGSDKVGPTVFGHSGTAGAISVGAVPFFDGTEAEEYSSRGPVGHDFGPVEGFTPASQLPIPEILSKPDVAATDCGKTTFFASFTEFIKGEGEAWHFCGTSAAAPHAAAVAALMVAAEPGADPAEIRSALQAGAAAVPNAGPCAVGAGLVDAVGAIEELPPPPSFEPPECPEPLAEVSTEEARASGDWGLEVPPVPPVVATPVTSTAEHAPHTFIRRKPPHLIRTRSRTARVVFRFGSDETDVTFACRIDGGLFRPCPQRLARRFGVGWHTLRVVAREPNGEGDRTPAVYRFKVKQVG